MIEHAAPGSAVRLATDSTTAHIYGLKVTSGICDSYHYLKGWLIKLNNRCSKISNTSCLPKRPRQTGQTQIRQLLKKLSNQDLSYLLYPPQTLFVVGILFSRCLCVRVCVRPSITFRKLCLWWVYCFHVVRACVCASVRASVRP